MHALRIAIAVVWVLFWIYWLVSAGGAKERAAGTRRVPAGGVIALPVILILRVFNGGSLAVHSLIVGAVGAVLVGLGLGLAIWARVNLGRNWGMPMTQKAEPELVRTGPYHVIRHPIYSGLLLATVGTALVSNVIDLLFALVVGAFFYYSATVEERNLTASFPEDYPAYQAKTKKLIPFLL